MLFVEHFDCDVVQGLLAAEREHEVTELVAKLHQERMDAVWKSDLLQHLIQRQSENQSDEFDVGYKYGTGTVNTLISFCHHVPQNCLAL